MYTSFRGFELQGLLLTLHSTPEQTSALLKLPPELRNQIYDILLANVDGCLPIGEILCQWAACPLIPEGVWLSPWPVELKLNLYALAMTTRSATCCQLHSETAVLPFKVAELYIHLWSCEDWLYYLTARQRCTVRNLRTDVYYLA